MFFGKLHKRKGVRLNELLDAGTAYSSLNMRKHYMLVSFTVISKDVKYINVKTIPDGTLCCKHRR